MVWKPPPRAAFVDRINAIGEGLGDAGRSMFPLDAAALLTAARDATGLEDFGDEGFRDGLDRLTTALDQEAGLHAFGRLLARGELQRILQNRLRVEQMLRVHPEIESLPVRRPLVITGLGRSGTTLLHELLALDPANRVPRLFELMYPVPPPDPATASSDPRIALAQREITLMDAAVPAFTGMHENAGHLPNECIFLFAHVFATDLWTGEFRIPSYSGWLAGADLAPVYAAHRRLLRLLGSREEAPRWVLKAPSHLSSLPALLAEYPDAHVVLTHRDPVRVIGSLTNLMATLQWMRSDRVDHAGVVAAISFGFPFLWERVMKQRDEGLLPEAQLHDVLYRDLIEDPVGTVGQLYAELDWELAPAVVASMRAHVAARAGGGGHEYSLSDTGLELEAERARYAGYQERYRVPSEL